jgi:hypothetical protein
MNRLDLTTDTSPSGAPHEIGGLHRSPDRAAVSGDHGKSLRARSARRRGPRMLARLFRLVGLAVGAAVASAQPAGRLPGRGQRPRQSLVALGQSWLEHVRERLTLAWGCAQRPPPHLRRFAWLLSTRRQTQK